jgi:hypothetical protein
MEEKTETNPLIGSTLPLNGNGATTHRAIFDIENVGVSNQITTNSAQPMGAGDNHQAVQYANPLNEALHLMKPSGETGRALSPVRSAINPSVQMQSIQTVRRKKRLGFAGIKLSGPVSSTFTVPRHETKPAHPNISSIGHSTPTPGGAETRLISSAVANEGEGATALTDVTRGKKSDCCFQLVRSLAC